MTTKIESIVILFLSVDVCMLLTFSNFYQIFSVSVSTKLYLLTQLYCPAAYNNNIIIM